MVAPATLPLQALLHCPLGASGLHAQGQANSWAPSVARWAPRAAESLLREVH